MRVAISAGHALALKGKKLVSDPGAVNKKYSLTEAKEVGKIQDLIFKISRESAAEGLEIIRICRIPLQERIRLINYLHEKCPLDLAVEIHLNASKSKRVSGTEVLYWPSSEKGKFFADVFLSQIAKELSSKKRGIKSRRDLAFLRNCVPPSIITESEFITNEEVAKLLKKGILQPLIAFAHFRALLEILKEKGGVS